MKVKEGATVRTKDWGHNAGREVWSELQCLLVCYPDESHQWCGENSGDEQNIQRQEWMDGVARVSVELPHNSLLPVIRTTVHFVFKKMHAESEYM